MDIRRMLDDMAYFNEMCNWLMEKASAYLPEREALEEKDRRETVTCVYSKSGQDLSPFGYYSPCFFSTVNANAVRGRLYKEKPESYAYEYHLNQDGSFIAIHNGPLTKNPYWHNTTYYFREKDYEFGFSIARRRRDVKQIMPNLSFEWCIENVTYAKIGSTEAEKEIITLLCRITAQERNYSGIRAEFCDKIDENLFLSHEYHQDRFRGKWLRIDYHAEVELNKRGKLIAVKD